LNVCQENPEIVPVMFDPKKGQAISGQDTDYPLPTTHQNINPLPLWV
jgi:hypothetical protein